MTSPTTPWQPLTVADATALGWTGGPYMFANATRAYSEWRLVTNDQRAYLGLTLKWMNERFDAVWNAIGEGPVPENGLEQIDLFDQQVGIEPQDWEWMLFASVVRDAVTAYEVYVVKAYLEVVEFQEGDYKHDEDAPRFAVARKQSKILGLEVRPQSVDDVFALRNVLTHQRGQLRTEKDRAEYGDKSSPWSSIVAHLDEARVLSLLDVLEASVMNLDPIYWAHTWGKQPAPAVKA